MEIAPGTYTAFGYRAVKVARRDGMVYQTGNGDYHDRWDREALLRQHRAFDRDNVLGPGGFKLQARVGGPNPNKTAVAINRQIEEELWPAFAAAPETRNLLTWNELERLCLREMAAGDVGFITWSKRGQLQAIESEQITTRKTNLFGRQIEQGIELSRLGSPVAYYVATDDTRTKDTRIRAADFILCRGVAKRITSTRGVPVLVPSFPMLHRLDDIFNSEAIAWQIMARLVLAINRDNGMPAFGDDAGTADDLDDTGDVANIVRYFQEGMLFDGGKGGKVEGINQNRPGQQFEKVIYTFLRCLCLPLGMPVEVFLADYGSMNYSSARAALTQFYRTARNWQTRMIDQFHAKVYAWCVERWVRDGIIPQRPDIAAHEWQPSPLPWIDPQKEAQAVRELLDLGLVTYDQACRMLDRDGAQMVEDRIASDIRAIEAADRVEEATGVSVPWQRYAGQQVGRTEAAVIAGKNAQQEGPSTEDQAEDTVADDPTTAADDMENENE